MNNSFLPTYIVRDNDGNKTGEIYTQENDFNIIFFKWAIMIILCVMVAPIVSVFLFAGYFIGKYEEPSVWLLPLAILSSIYLLVDINNHWVVSIIMGLWLEPQTILFWRAVDTVVLISSVMLIPVTLLTQSLVVKTSQYVIDALVVLVGILITIIFF